ncbi:polysaccharide pyruvyl transferase family protein [Kitasatospora sp. NBC_01250]|uniref:polysaccharide pyruvyl transferase family protein n=1 Tax=Kitasatospora sp. NBC_01250 TaxID=2903571 RepID=UPI002E307724|nr:polysaccharide pyruvyl transferase family protein [Kitasatospora sp. NBC_01250]
MVDGERCEYYLVCPAGIPNYGDELIAATWLRHLAQVAPDADVVVDCLGPQAAADRLRGLHPRVRFQNVLWQLCVDHWSPDPAATARAVAATVDAAGRPAAADGLGALRHARVVHLLGGGFINAIWAPFAGLLAGITAATRRSGGRAAMTGQGLWPPAEGKSGLIRSLAEGFEVVDVRDEASAELVGCAASRSCDDVFLGMGPHLFDSRDEVPEVMVSLQSLLAETGPQDLVGFVVRTLREWGADRVGLLECAPDQDVDVLAAARQALPDARVYSMADVLRDGLPARPGQAWLTTRFHPHLVAAAAGAAGVALSIKPDYYGIKHRSLTDIGSKWRLLEGLDVPERPTAGGYRPEDLTRLRAAKRAVADRVYAPDTAG